ncbi:MAG: sensor histidine kinase [Calditrichia bacterium]
MEKEVTCRIIAPILEAIKNKEVPPEIWLKGIPYPTACLQNKNERIEWHVYCRLLKNLRPLFSDDDFEEIGWIWAKSPLYRPWAIMTRLFFNMGKSLHWTQAALQRAGNQFFSCIDFRLADMGPNGFKVTLRVKDDYEFCREHFLFVKGAMRYVPGFKGYLDVNVKMEWIPRGAVYENAFSRPMITPSWLQKKVMWTLSARSAVRGMIEAHDALLERYQELEKSRREQEQFSQKLIESQERERKRIASELHDSLGQNLLIISNELAQYLENRKSRRQDLRRICGLIQESIDETREIAQNLHPHQLERLGLTKAIQSSINRIAHPTVIRFDSRIDDVDQVLPPPLEIHFYRIIQEALNNIVKHSGASEAIVEISRKPDQICVVIKDNGKGFYLRQDVSTGKEPIGYGMSDMTERARLLKADFKISSNKGNGTQLNMAVPIQKVL